MKRICIAIGLSLFVSLIHAAVMPFDLSAHQAPHQITAIDSTAHHCDEVVSDAQDTHTKQQCHGGSYQCCLGIVISSAFVINLTAEFTGTLISQYSSLDLQPMMNLIYKPPKA